MSVENILGRESEILQFNDFLQEIEGGNGRLLTILGGDSSGKTFFAQSLLESGRLPYEIGRYSNLAGKLPYDGLQQIIVKFLYKLFKKRDIEEDFKNKFHNRFGELAAILNGFGEYFDVEQSFVIDESSFEIRNRINTLLVSLIEFIQQKQNSPILLCLDNMQWADPGTLDLIELLNNTNLNKVGIVLVFNTDEAEEILIPIGDNTILLNTFEKDELRELIKRSLPTKYQGRVEFIDDILIRSKGKPKAIVSLLKNFSDKEKWSGEELDNIVMIDDSKGKLKQLSDEELAVLKNIACFGNHLNVIFISKILRKELNALNEMFKRFEALRIITKVDLFNSDNQEVNYEFTSDHLHKEVLTHIPVKEKKELHKRIAFYYQNEVALGFVERDLFEALFHINLANEGEELTTDNKRQLTDLNLKAIKRAIISSSFWLAEDLCQKVEDYNFCNDWINNYEKTKEFYLLKYRVFRLLGNEVKADEVFKVSANHLKSSDVNYLRLSKIIYDIQYGNLKEAVNTGIEALNSEGYKISTEAGRLTILKHFLKVKFLMGNKSIEKLLNAPECKDPQVLNTMKIMSWMFRGAQYLYPELNGVLALLLLQLTLKEGNSALTFNGYMAYGVIIGAGMGDYEKAYKYGELGYNISKNYGYEGGDLIFGKAVYLTFKEPLRNSLDLYDEAREKSYALGDFISAAETTVNNSLSYYLSGIPIHEVKEKVKENLTFCQKVGSNDFRDFQTVFLRDLEVISDTPYADKVEDEFLKIIQNTEYTFTLAVHQFMEIQKLCLTCKFQEAERELLKLEKYTPSFTGLFVNAEYLFYKAIIYLMHRFHKYPGSKSNMKKANKSMKILRKMAISSPENHSGKLDLLYALQLHLRNDNRAAIDKFTTAINHLSTNNFSQHAAFGTHLLGKVYKANGQMDAAKSSYHQAQVLYAQWGMNLRIPKMEENSNPHYPH